MSKDIIPSRRRQKAIFPYSYGYNLKKIRNLLQKTRDSVTIKMVFIRMVLYHGAHFYSRRSI